MRGGDALLMSKSQAPGLGDADASGEGAEDCAQDEEIVLNWGPNPATMCQDPGDVTKELANFPLSEVC